MTDAALLFMGFLDQKGIKYSSSETDSGSAVVKIGYSGDNFQNQQFIFFFDSDSHAVNIKAFSVCKVHENKLAEMYKTLNNINSNYRWVKYYIDKDNEVTLSGDAVIDLETIGDECFELLIRFITIHDEAYVEIMKTNLF